MRLLILLFLIAPLSGCLQAPDFDLGMGITRYSDPPDGTSVHGATWGLRDSFPNMPVEAFGTYDLETRNVESTPVQISIGTQRVLTTKWLPAPLLEYRVDGPERGLANAKILGSPIDSTSWLTSCGDPQWYQVDADLNAVSHADARFMPVFLELQGTAFPVRPSEGGDILKEDEHSVLVAFPAKFAEFPIHIQRWAQWPPAVADAQGQPIVPLERWHLRYERDAWPTEIFLEPSYESDPDGAWFRLRGGTWEENDVGACDVKENVYASRDYRGVSPGPYVGFTYEELWDHVDLDLTLIGYQQFALLYPDFVVVQAVNQLEAWEVHLRDTASGAGYVFQCMREEGKGILCDGHDESGVPGVLIERDVYGFSTLSRLQDDLGVICNLRLDFQEVASFTAQFCMGGRVSGSLETGDIYQAQLRMPFGALP